MEQMFVTDDYKKKKKLWKNSVTHKYILKKINFV
jgi:hypothetical protein